MSWAAGGDVGYVLIVRLLADIERHRDDLRLLKIAVSPLTRENAQTCRALRQPLIEVGKLMRRK